jgi:DNA repair exonuclease SbcCD ATPase subunit
LQQLTDETQEAAETQRQLGMDLKKAMAPVKAKERNINLIKREQNAALRNLQNARKALQDERDAILAAAGHSDEAKRAATLKEAEAEHDQLVDKINHLKQATTMSFCKYEEMEPSVDAAKNQMDGISRQMQGITHKLRNSKSRVAQIL